MAVAILSGAGLFGEAVSFTERLVLSTIGPACLVYDGESSACFIVVFSTSVSASDAVPVFNGLMDHVGPFVVSLFVGTVSSSVVDVINSTVQEVE